MLNNKADTIEDYILQQLSSQQENSVELSRTELADKIRCAPSQVSYVLNTRFTHERGFIVESRRGLGGYIRVTIVTDTELEKKILYNDFINEINDKTPFEDVKNMLAFLLQNKLITRREFELSARMAASLYKSELDKKLIPSERTKLLRSIFSALADIS